MEVFFVKFSFLFNVIDVEQELQFWAFSSGVKLNNRLAEFSDRNRSVFVTIEKLKDSRDEKIIFARNDRFKLLKFDFFILSFEMGLDGVLKVRQVVVGQLV